MRRIWIHEISAFAPKFLFVHRSTFHKATILRLNKFEIWKKDIFFYDLHFNSLPISIGRLCVRRCCNFVWMSNEMLIFCPRFWKCSEGGSKMLVWQAKVLALKVSCCLWIHCRGCYGFRDTFWRQSNRTRKCYNVFEEQTPNLSEGGTNMAVKSLRNEMANEVYYEA